MLSDENILYEKSFDYLGFSPDVLIDCKDIQALSFGNHTNLWNYFMMKYSQRTPIRVYQIESYFKASLEVLFTANNYKYKRLLETQMNYDILSPYNIKEEHVVTSKTGKTKTSPNLTNEVTEKETSFDNLTPKLANVETSTSSGTTTTEIEHTVSEVFETDNKTLNDVANSEKRLDSRKGNIGNHANSDLISKERKVADFTLWDIICKDIVDYTCYKFIV